MMVWFLVFTKKGASKLLLLGFSSFSILSIIATLPMLFLQNVSLATDDPNHWVEGVHEFYNDSKVYFDIYPKTTRGEPVNINLTLKVFTGAVDVVIGINTSDMDILGLERYNRRNNSITRTARCHALFWYNYTLSPKHAWCWQNTTIYDDLNNSVGTNYSLVWERDFEAYDLTKNEIYWTEYVIAEWDNIAGLFDKTEYEYQGFNTWYYASGLSVEDGKNYLLRFFPGIVPNKTGKYFFGIKPSSETFSEAVAQNAFYYVDPGYNSSTAFKRRFNVNVTGNAGIVTNLTLSINGTPGLTVGGSSGINMHCKFPKVNGTYYLYYNDEADVQVTNEEEDLRLPCKGEILGVNHSTSYFFTPQHNDSYDMRIDSNNDLVSFKTGSVLPDTNTPSQVEQIDGVVGSGTEFTDAGDYFLGDDNDGDISGSVAIVTHLRLDTMPSGARGAVVNKLDGSDNRYSLSVGTVAGAQTLGAQIQISGSSSNVNTAGGKDTGEWHHLAMTYDQSTLFFYENASLIGTANTASGSFPGVSGDPCIGSEFFSASSCNANEVIDGVIGGIDFYNKNLSQDEITVLYECTRGADQGTCWDFELEESTGNANETEGRDAIVQGIINALGSSVPVYTDQQIYARNSAGTQNIGTFDKAASSGNKRWAFNYVTAGESNQSIGNVTPSFYTLEMSNLQSINITTLVEDFIINKTA